jgi:hypothetical protein
MMMIDDDDDGDYCVEYSNQDYTKELNTPACKATVIATHNNNNDNAYTDCYGLPSPPKKTMKYDSNNPLMNIHHNTSCKRYNQHDDDN